MNAQIMADRVARRRLQEDVGYTRHGIPPLSMQDMDWDQWRARLISRITLAFDGTGTPDVDALESALACGLAALERLDAQLTAQPTSGEAA